jgi:long-chain acyl-CoA synthetase
VLNSYDIYTIVYTSGTTGNPKGVVNNFYSASFAATQGARHFNLSKDDSAISFLPLAHVAERVLVELPSLYAGYTVSFTESLDTFAQDLQMVSPTLFFAVPRLWTKFQMGVLEKLPQKKLNILLRIPIVRGLVKKKIRKGLGLNNAKMLMSGAAPLAVSVMEWFARLDINILEGYGMSENLAYGTINRSNDNRLGTVGLPLPGCHVKISNDGEILIKSPATMQGYYLDDEKTKEVIKDGYYHTGDKGEMCNDGYLKITGRIKDTADSSRQCDTLNFEGQWVTLTVD